MLLCLYYTQLQEIKREERLRELEAARDVELMSKAEQRDHRIRMAAEIAKNLEERRQRRTRRQIVKKFLKSAALQMTALEDVEKDTELKTLREQKRKVVAGCGPPHSPSRHALTRFLAVVGVWVYLSID